MATLFLDGAVWDKHLAGVHAHVANGHGFVLKES